MGKQPISVTLSPENLLWLRGRVAASGARSISEVLGELIQQARCAQEIRSVVGTISIARSDPELSSADAIVRRALAKSLARTRKRRSA